MFLYVDQMILISSTKRSKSLRIKFRSTSGNLVKQGTTILNKSYDEATKVIFRPKQNPNKETSFKETISAPNSKTGFIFKNGPSTASFSFILIFSNNQYYFYSN